jgi:ribonucleoside-diphosphate reductase alpha chain
MLEGHTTEELEAGINGRRPPLRHPIELPENGRLVLTKRYLRRGEDGKPLETIEEMFWRVAWNVAAPEEQYHSDRQAVAEQYYDLLTSRRFFPNSPTFTGAGTPLGQLSACFVLAIDDDMGRTPHGIFQTLRDAALIQQTGGGNGFSFSRLRPKGAFVKSSGGAATGPVGFLRVYDQAFGEVAQGGTRRGANMAVLRVDHPDIREFITCKTDESHITNFNISVGITDAFMEAVKKDALFDLVSPQDGKVWETVRAREIFDLIVRQAYHNGEPGMLFLDTANRDNPVPHLYTLEATNPCGEQWLGPGENCCLGSINLAMHVAPDGQVDWEKLRQSVELSTRFLDDVVDANAYVPAVPELEIAAHRVRRLGLGIMGLADLMYHCGIRYGSAEGEEFASQVMEFVHYHAMRVSVELARARGAFPAIRGSLYDPLDLKWQPPQPLVPYVHDWGRPPLDWQEVVDGIKQHGIRNGAVTTIAPTGTISTVAGCEGYGCEPVFALAYIRHFNDNGKDVQLQYTSPLFEKALIEAGLSEETRRRIIEQVNLTGSCQAVPEVPQSIRHTFVVASDITAEEHVRMQAALQRFVSNAISKTCNFPSTATPDDVAKAFMLAWELGCKGLTVYVAGSREKVVLETAETAQKKGAAKMEKSKVSSQSEPQPESVPKAEETRPPEPRAITISPGLLPLFGKEPKKPRGRVLPGYTYRVETPVGTTFVTVNENGGKEPFEVFLHTSKAGSETAAVSEAMGRLISYILRMRSPIPPHERLQEVIRQLEGIGGGRSLGLGPNRVRSLPDGIAQVLDEYLREHHSGQEVYHREPEPEAVPASSVASEKPSAPGQMALIKFGDLCPECGEAAVVNEEGCRKCYACGYSEC